MGNVHRPQAIEVDGQPGLWWMMKTSMIIHEISGILLERDRENGLDMNRFVQTQLDI